MCPTFRLARAKAVGRETLRIGGKILIYIADKSPEVSPKYIVSKHVTESVQNLIGNYTRCAVYSHDQRGLCHEIARAL
jgi:hypothetical protein